MGIGEKISRAFKKIRGKLIVSGILWFILTIVFVAPWGLSYAVGARISGDSNMTAFTRDGWSEFFKSLGTNIMHPLSSTISCLAGEAEGHFWGTWWKFSVVYLFAISIGLAKAIPVDKRGNVNVLVVGRIWFW